MCTHSLWDIQVMTPMRKGALGVETPKPDPAEDYLNPPDPSKQREKISGGTIYRDGR